MDNLTDEIILKELNNRLSMLILEEKEAEHKKVLRDDLIAKTKLAISAFDKTASKKAVEKIESTVDGDFNYPKKGTWHDRIIAYMKYYNKALTISDLADALKEYESEYTESKLHGALSNMMTSLVKKGETVKFKADKGKALYYASPKWFDENNNLKDEHKPIKKEVSLWDK